MNSLRSFIHTDKPNMMNIAQKESPGNLKQPLFAGIDVEDEILILVIRKNSKSLNP